MIHFALICHEGHEFDGWFRNNNDFEEQKETILLTCPLCGSEKIEKALMAPAVQDSKNRIGMGLNKNQKKLLETIRNFKKYVRTNADYVGDHFNEEARKIHFGETEKRSIYGEATKDEVISLLEDGINVLPLPELPEDKN